MVELNAAPEPVLARVRKACLALPEAHEEPAWAGSFFKVRRRTFAHVFAVEDAHDETPMLVCRADAEEREVLLRIGHPFFAPRGGIDRLGMVLGDDTDWDEVAELVTESYRLLAPKKLAALVEPPA